MFRLWLPKLRAFAWAGPAGMDFIEFLFARDPHHPKTEFIIYDGSN